MNIRALLIDDEPTNTENLRILLQTYCPQVDIVGIAHNRDEALEKIKAHKPDVLFLDVEMPEHDGFSILEAVGDHRSFDVIFVTAFNQYALEAIKFSALDYLLKPIRIEELQLAVSKLEDKRRASNYSQRLENMLHNLQRKNQDKKIAISTIEHIHFIALSQILYCQSDNNYTTFFLNDGQKIIASSTLKTYERLLKSYGFFRIHQSYLINLHYVEAIVRKEGGVKMRNGDQVLMSRHKKDALMEALAEVR